MSVSAVGVIATLGTIGLVIKSVNDIIEECDRNFDLVNKELERINQISGGQFNANLIETGNKLKVHYKDLMGGLRKMIEAIQAIHDENKKADETAANSLKGANSKY